MTIDDHIRYMASSDILAGHHRDDQEALRRFTAAAQLADSDPGEARRIRNLAELVDAELAALDLGLAALDRGDAGTAETLLLQAVSAGLGDADAILAELLTGTPDVTDSLGLQRRVAEALADRVILNAAYQRFGESSASKSGWRSLLRRGSSKLRRPAVAPVKATASDVAEVLMTAMEVKDSHTRRHSERISQLVVLIADQIGMRQDGVEAARLAGLLHDIGKLAIPATVLHKAGPLTVEEFALVQLHVAHGVSIVAQMPKFFEATGSSAAWSPLLDAALTGIMHHHERFDGRGYPMGLAGDEIPPIARAVAVADAFDAMRIARSYRPGRSLSKAAAELRRSAGRCFDPQMVEAFLSVLDTHTEQIEELTRADEPGVVTPGKFTDTDRPFLPRC